MRNRLSWIVGGICFVALVCVVTLDSMAADWDIPAECACKKKGCDEIQAALLPACLKKIGSIPTGSIIASPVAKIAIQVKTDDGSFWRSIVVLLGHIRTHANDVLTQIATENPTYKAINWLALPGAEEFNIIVTTPTPQQGASQAGWAMDDSIPTREQGNNDGYKYATSTGGKKGGSACILKVQTDPKIQPPKPLTPRPPVLAMGHEMVHCLRIIKGINTICTEAEAQATMPNLQECLTTAGAVKEEQCAVGCTECPNLDAVNGWSENKLRKALLTARSTSAKDLMSPANHGGGAIFTGMRSLYPGMKNWACTPSETVP